MLERRAEGGIGVSDDRKREDGQKGPRTLTGETDRAMVERHIREGLVQLARQREIVEEQDPDSPHAETSRRLLDTMERTQKAHETHLERIKRRDGED